MAAGPGRRLPPSLPRPDRRRIFLLGGLAALLALLYGSSLRAGIYWDDPIWFEQAMGETPRTLLFGSPGYHYYRLLALLYYRLWARDGLFLPTGPHLAELACHFCVVILSLGLARRWTATRIRQPSRSGGARTRPATPRPATPSSCIFWTRRAAWYGSGTPTVGAGSCRPRPGRPIGRSSTSGTWTWRACPPAATAWWSGSTTTTWACATPPSTRAGGACR